METWQDVCRKHGIKTPDALSPNQRQNYERWYKEGVLEENLPYIVKYSGEREALMKKYGISAARAQEMMTTHEEKLSIVNAETWKESWVAPTEKEVEKQVKDLDHRRAIAKFKTKYGNYILVIMMLGLVGIAWFLLMGQIRSG